MLTMKRGLMGYLLMVVISSCIKAPSAIELISTPCIQGGEPNYHVKSDGSLLLSWIEYQGDTVSLQFSEWTNDEWSKPKVIEKGSDWFVNWADFPSLVSHWDNPEHLTAHWLQKSDVGTFDYDVRISQSKDNGENWSESFVIHEDQIAAEHGFVSLLPMKNGRIIVTWLDGRNTKGDTSNHKGHEHHGAMSLRAAEIDINGQKYFDEEIDDKVCDCCQTSTAMTKQGPVVVYRDRSDEEVRDIYLSRRQDGQWTAPQAVYHDNWTIDGCPVNGPVVVANDEFVAVAWFSMADNSPEVKVSFSYDNGDNFDLPFRIDNGNPLGRIDMKILYSNVVVVTWMEQVKSEAEIVMAKVDHQSGVIEKRHIIATDQSRRSGFPQLELLGNDLFFAWTTVDSTTIIKTGVLKGNN